MLPKGWNKLYSNKGLLPKKIAEHIEWEWADTWYECFYRGDRDNPTAFVVTTNGARAYKPEASDLGIWYWHHSYKKNFSHAARLKCVWGSELHRADEINIETINRIEVHHGV